MVVCVCVCVCVWVNGWRWRGGAGGGRRLYAIASAIVLNADSWISLTYSGAIERKQVAEYGGVREGGLL